MRTALRHRAAETPAAIPLFSARYPLSGHSGAQVMLHMDGRDSFVRKTAASPVASARLKAQADKQHAFWMLGLPFPKVRGQDTDAAGRGSFDMNYIPGRTIADAVINGGSLDPAAATRAVERLLRLFAMAVSGPLPPHLFEDKIEDVMLTAGLAEDVRLRDDIQGCGEKLLDRDWTGIPETPCHGDLTLENILLTAGKSIAFIDCDVPFASSWWLDFGKLFQDIAGHWCIRVLYAERDPVRLLNARQKLEQLAAQFHILAAELDGGLSARLPQLAALGLYRALPYARSDALRQFVCGRIAHLLESGDA